MAPGSKDSNSNPVQNLTCINNAPAFSSQSGVRPAPEILYSSRPPHTKMTVVCKAKLPQIIEIVVFIRLERLTGGVVLYYSIEKIL